jgi:hypothetical protein
VLIPGGESRSIGQYRGQPGNTGVFQREQRLSVPADYNFDRKRRIP